MNQFIAALFLVCALAPAHAADYWLCVDADGHRTAQDRPCADGMESQPGPTSPALSVTPAAEPKPLVPRMEFSAEDLAALERQKPLLRRMFLALMGLLVLVLLLRGLRRLRQAWAAREPRSSKPAAPERIEPSESLRRHSQDE